MSFFVEYITNKKVYVIMTKRGVKKGEKNMEFNEKTRKVLFVIFYTFITILLVLNTIKSRLLVDMVYSLIFIILYLKYLYKLAIN